MDGSTAKPDRATLLLSGDEITALMTCADDRAVVAAAFRAHAPWQGCAPAPMHIEGDGGGFHVKGAGFPVVAHELAVAQGVGRRIVLAPLETAA